MEAAEDGNVFIEALPPATDYVTYLMLLEYNLGKDDLPVLHGILQDEKLVVNIGWDLVQILLPLLPESEQCLQDVAALGNPREVVLKVDEQLEQLARRIESAAQEDEESDGSDTDQEVSDRRHEANAASKAEDAATLQTLLQMLCVIHPRIKTKRPSRFLETSTQPILRAYRCLASSPAATRAVLMFIKAMSGTNRPAPPARNQEAQIPLVVEHSAAPDPEGQEDGEDPEEAKTQRSLLQAMLTHVIALYLDSCQNAGTYSALAWTERVVEKRMPERRPPFRKSCTELFQESDELRLRDVLVSQILMIAVTDLKMDWRTAMSLLKEDPASTSEVAASKSGCLFLLAALATKDMLISHSQEMHLSVFPDHDDITTSILGDPADGVSADVSSMTVDGLIVTGWLALDTGGLESVTDPKQDDKLYKYLQKLSALAATHPLPTLRAQAHLFMTTILHSHASSSARLSFIDDTLQHCPFSNLKEAAIGWAKAEFTSACGREPGASNVFAKPETLNYLATELFAFDPSETVLEEFVANSGLHLAALSLLYLICSSPSLSKKLDVRAMLDSRDVDSQYLQRMDGFISQAKADLEKPTNTDPVDLSELHMLSSAVARAREAVRHLQADS